jgi:glyoxylase I family protein
MFVPSNELSAKAIWRSDRLAAIRSVSFAIDYKRRSQSNNQFISSRIIKVRITKIHHVAIICSNYKISKRFYVDLLKFSIITETYRSDRDSYKLDLKVSDRDTIELFSFPSPPPRTSKPEACGLRHLAFEVDNIEENVDYLISQGVAVEAIRVDEITGKKFTFFKDPDNLPLEMYEL